MTATQPATGAGSLARHASSTRHSPGDIVRTFLRGVGQTLITLGVVLLLFVVYELWVTNLVTAQEQDRLAEQLTEQWRNDPTSVPTSTDAPAADIGDAFAVLHIPRFGGDWNRVVVEGTGTEQLKKGPGHMPGTALPGQLGNTVLSGHRTTYGAPFADLDQLRAGDAVVVETGDTWFTYRVSGHEIVRPTDVEVALPVPKHPGVEPTGNILTLTTCHPKYSAAQRLIVYADLAETLPKSEGTPAVLAEV